MESNSDRVDAARKPCESEPPSTGRGSRAFTSCQPNSSARRVVPVRAPAAPCLFQHELPRRRAARRSAPVPSRRGGRHPIPAVQGRDIRIGLRGLPLDGGIQSTNRLGDARKLLRVARFVYTLRPMDLRSCRGSQDVGRVAPTKPGDEPVRCCSSDTNDRRPSAASPRRGRDEPRYPGPLPQALRPTRQLHAQLRLRTRRSLLRPSCLDTRACAYSSALADGTDRTEELRGGPTMAPLSRVTSAAPSQ